MSECLEEHEIEEYLEWAHGEFEASRTCANCDKEKELYRMMDFQCESCHFGGILSDSRSFDNPVSYELYLKTELVNSRTTAVIYKVQLKELQRKYDDLLKHSAVIKRHNNKLVDINSRLHLDLHHEKTTKKEEI